MRLSGQLSAEFQKVLLDAFDRESLTQMVAKQLNENLDNIVPDGKFESITFNLIQEFARRDKVLELAEAAVKENPDNQQLRAFADKLKTQPIESQTLVVENSNKKLSGLEQLELKKTLNSLVSTQLDDLIMLLEVPPGLIPGDVAAPGNRTSALINWAKSPTGKGLGALQEALKKLDT